MPTNKQFTIKSLEDNDKTLFKLKEDLKVFINLNSKRYSSLDEQLKEFLSYGNQLTGFKVGIVSHIVGETYTIVQTVSEGDILAKGDVFNLNDTICKIIVTYKESRIYDKIKGSEVENVGAVVGLGLQSYIGCPIIVNNEVYGTLNFSKQTEIEDLERFKHSFSIIEIMAQVVGVLISKHQQIDIVKELNISLKDTIEKLESKNAQLEEFSYIAAHDLQEPLRNVKNMANFISKEASNESEAMTKGIGYLLSATDRMSNLVFSLMQYAKIGADKELEVVDCQKILEEVQDDLQLQIAEKEAKISYHNLPKIKGYKVETRLLFQNLIANALKYQKENIPPEIELSCEEEEQYILFQIKDNGIGIKENIQKKIFKIFQKGQKDRKGIGSIGIGLAHCVKIVELYDGQIWCESEYNKGSTFYVKLKKL